MENVDKTNTDNSKKRILLGSLIIVVSIIIIGLSLSYAYYLNTVEEVNPGNQGTNITSGELTMNFTTTQLINANSAGLINDAEVLTEADYTSFSVTLPSDADATEATYSLYLTELTITDNLKSNYVKWALYNADGSSMITSGDFLNATSGTNLTLQEGISISKGETDGYRLYIWLSNDPDVNQTSLLNGSLSAKVGFRAVTN